MLASDATKNFFWRYPCPVAPSLTATPANASHGIGMNGVTTGTTLLTWRRTESVHLEAFSCGFPAQNGDSLSCRGIKGWSVDSVFFRLPQQAWADQYSDESPSTWFAVDQKPDHLLRQLMATEQSSDG